MGHTYMKKTLFTVYLKSSVNWAPCVLSVGPTEQAVLPLWVPISLLEHDSPSQRLCTSTPPEEGRTGTVSSDCSEPGPAQET